MLSSAAELKLFYHLSQKILAGEVRTFAALAEEVHGLGLKFKPDAVLDRCFALLKEVRWGFLQELTRSDFPKLWKELVLPHSEYPAAGDLKRNISIANIYIAMLDIHGYTRFCQDSKGNLSRLRKLDEFLHDGIRKIARSNSALANRERGDEIVVVAPSATDIIKTTLEIINTFSKHPSVREESVARNRSDYSIVLPDFKITAGIAGGNLTTPLIITESGLVSGFLLNTAARLQTLANEFSPRDSKIITTNGVYSSFQKENKMVRSELAAKNILRFFNLGMVSFKGTKVNCYEIIYDSRQHFREKYAPALETLFKSLRQGLWKGRVFTDLMDLVVQLCAVTPPFTAELFRGKERVRVTNSSLAQLCQQATQTYQKDDYPEAVGLLGEIRDQAEGVPELDRLAVRYLTEVYNRFRLLAEELGKRTDGEVETKIDQVFENPKYRTAYLNSRKALETYEKLRNFALRSPALTNRKSAWYALIEENKEALALEIYSGKK
jgi:hypothetical protein